MKSFAKMETTKLLVFLGYILTGIMAKVPVVPPAGTLSSLALGMQAVCYNSSVLGNFRSKCPNSASTIYPDRMPNPKPEVPELHYILVKRQNHIILSELIRSYLHNASHNVSQQEPKFGFELLSGVFGVYEKMCPKVPALFLQKVFNLFTRLHWKVAADRSNYLPRKYQKWVTRLFNNCTEAVEPLPFMTDSCKETIIAVKNCSNFICTQATHEFRLMKSDPLVDIVFKAFELVQSVCFPLFQESARMFHYFHLGVTDLFTDDIKIRWMTQLEDHHFWKTLLGPNYQTHLINIERCNQATIANQIFKYRIHRETVPARIRLTGVKREFD